MAITPRKELEYDILWFLRMIESELITHPKSNKIKFPFNTQKIMFSETGEKPSYDRQKTIITDLEIQKVLELKTEEPHVIYTLPSSPLTLKERHDPLYHLKNYTIGEEVVPKQDFLIINKKIFEEFYAKFRRQTENEGNDKIKKSREIIKLELLEDKDEIKKITVYINIEYKNPRSYSRKKNWSKMYQLAKEQQVSYDKGFFDYFNSNKINPLYSKEGFNVTKILKQEDGAIVPNIGIEIVTQKAVTQRLKSA